MFSSKIGLYKSIQKYNGNYDIINYATIYVRSELLRLITDKYSTSILPKSIRRSSKKQHSRQQLNNYKYSLDVTYANTYQNWKLERVFLSQQEDILEKNVNSDILNDILNYQTPFIKRIIYLKYFSNIKILSNKHVSELMCCSEETTRQNLRKINIIDG
jgi:RNA polymerase sigma factor (sigma-70 family)